MKKLGIAALALLLGSLAVHASAQTSINADVVTNTTWGPGTVVLERPIFVKSGATLTIQAGTIVRGQPRTGPVSSTVITGSPGALIITQTGRLIANGNALQPIIFTTAATDNDNNGIIDNVDLPANNFIDPWNPGDIFLDDAPATAPLAPLDKAGRATVSLWGGLVILGNAPTNVAEVGGVGYGEHTVEGLVLPGFSAIDATYGGVEPHDSSGSVKFVSIRHAGDELKDGNELNGLTLAGVGDGTVLENIEIYCNFDDGIEWFGGTVNGKNLATFFVGDDNFDMDQGYTGMNQFMFSIQPFFNVVAYPNPTYDPNDPNSPVNITAYGALSGDKVGELDGDDFNTGVAASSNNVNIRNDITTLIIDDTPWPMSAASIYNLTAIGSTPDVANPALPLGITAASANRGVQMRNGFAGSLQNSIVVNTGTPKGIELDLAANGAPGFNVVDNANSGILSVYCSTFQNTGAVVAAENTALANGDNRYTTTAADNNLLNSATFLGLQNESTYFNPTGNAAGKIDFTLMVTKINPRPVGPSIPGTGGCVVETGPGLKGVSYRGAFERVAPTLWTTGWTALSVGGLLAD